MKTNGKPIPVTIINGFLGSGKTTLVRKLLTQAQDDRMTPHVIVNDMSTLDVDGVLVANMEIVDSSQGNFITISGTSIHTPDGLAQLDDALRQFRQTGDVSWIIIETSGSSHPMPLVQYFMNRSAFDLRGVITLVDATWIEHDYESGRTLVPTWQENLSRNVRRVENLLAEQILFSSLVVLTKIDRLPRPVVQTIGQALHTINPHVPVQGISWGAMTWEQITSMRSYDYVLVEKLFGELEPVIAQEHRSMLTSQLLEDDRPFHPTRLRDTYQNVLTKGIFRSKGFFWLPSRDRFALLWSQATGNIGLEVVGYWRAGILEHDADRLTPQELEQLKQQLDRRWGRFGDRRCRLTVIGQPGEVERFIAALNQCFLTEPELSHWEDGGYFEDPWPT